MAPSAPTLPDPNSKKNILITSALPYVNNVPHLGNIIGSVLSADVFSRYCKARGYRTLFVCGSDEYGTATETKALEEGVDPPTLCAKYAAVHKDIYDWFNIDFDIFGKTPTPQQTEIVQDIFSKLWNNGYIEEKTTVQPFCPVPEHNTFLADRFVEGECSICQYPDARGDQCDLCGSSLDPLQPEPDEKASAGDDPGATATGWLINPRCKLDGATPEKRKTKHVFIRLDLLKDKITEWFKKASVEGAWSANSAQITQAWIDKGLRSRGISRDLFWGVPIPKGLKGLSEEEYAKKVFYVWFDACIGYVSITKCYTDGDNLSGRNWEKWWKNPENVRLYQFMGKDNVQFHTIIFPGSQLGTNENWTKLYKISTTEYLNYEGGKFSKSKNVGVFGNTARDTGIAADVWRYYLLSRRPETSDSEFKWQEFVDSNNNDLLKNLGNLNQRVVKFTQAKMDSVVPDYTKYTDKSFDECAAQVNTYLKEYIENLEGAKLRAGLVNVLHISALGNKLLQDNKLDNRLFSEEYDRCAAVIGTGLNLLNLLASILSPYMPATAKAMFQQLGTHAAPHIPDTWNTQALQPGHKIGEPQLLFANIPASKIDEWREAFGGEEVRRQKIEAAEKAAAKKAAKEKEKEKKKAKKAAAAAAAAGAGGSTDTRAETGGAASAPAQKAVPSTGVETEEKHEQADPAIETVTEAVENAEIHTS